MKRAGRSIEGVTLALLALAAPVSAYAQEPARNLPADAVTLEQIYARVWQRSPRLAAARALAVAVGAQKSAAGLIPDPSLQLGVMNLSLPNLRADMPPSPPSHHPPCDESRPSLRLHVAPATWVRRFAGASSLP
jgi:hypothetical protein